MLKYRYTFNGEVASKKNHKRLVYAGRNAVLLPSKCYQAWERAARRIIGLYGRPAAPFSAARLSIDIYHGDMVHRDTNNATQGIQDLLVDTGVIADDDWMTIGSPEVRHHIDVENPRMEVLVEEIQKEDFASLFKAARREKKKAARSAAGA